MAKKVAFYSSGHKLAGIIYKPGGMKSGEKRPGIVICHGFTGIKELYLPDVAKHLSSAGYVCLIFDYRGFGESEGPRWRLIPTEQVEDIRNALTFLSLQNGVDAGRLGLYGTSFGGANVSYTAGIDERVRCTVSTVGIGNGERWMKSLRQLWEWNEFLKTLAEDRKNRVMTGKSRYVEPHEIMVPDPRTLATHAEILKQFPERKCELPLETGEAVMDFKPEEVVDRVSPRAIMFIHAGDDALVPVEESRILYSRAGEPKRLHVIPDVAHHAVYVNPVLKEVMKAATKWYEAHL